MRRKKAAIEEAFSQRERAPFWMLSEDAPTTAPSTGRQS